MALTQRQWTNITQYVGSIIEFEMDSTGVALITLLARVLSDGYDSSDDSDTNELAQINQILNNPYTVFQSDPSIRNAEITEIRKVVHQKIYEHIQNYNANNQGIMPGLDDWLAKARLRLQLDESEPVFEPEPRAGGARTSLRGGWHEFTLTAFMFLGGALSVYHYGENALQAGVIMGALTGAAVSYTVFGIGALVKGTYHYFYKEPEITEDTTRNWDVPHLPPYNPDYVEIAIPEEGSAYAPMENYGPALYPSPR